MLVVVVALTIITAGAASAAIGSTLGAGGGTFAAGSVAAGTTAGLGNVALSAAIAGMAGSAVSQVATTGTLSLGDLLESGAIAGLTAGLTNGITYNATSGFGVTTAPIAADSGTYSLATLASSSSVGNFLVPVAGQATSVSGGTLAEAVLADATITAGVQTAIEGGSFLGNLEAAGVTEAAAGAADAIGNENLPIEESALAHAVLGCAASAVEGTGCAGGAIGGATSALVTPYIGSAVVGSGEATTEQAAIITALAGLAGGVVAGAAGADAQGGLTAAENEAQNNCTLHQCWNNVTSAFGSALASVESWVANPANQSTLWMTNVEATNAPGSSAETTAVEEAIPTIVAGETVVTTKGAVTGGTSAITTAESAGSGQVTSTTATNSSATGAAASTDSAAGSGSYTIYPLGSGASTGPLPPGYTMVTRWVSPEEASEWLATQGTAIPSGIGAGGRVYVTMPGAPQPGGTGSVQINFAVPQAAISQAGNAQWGQIFQPITSTPIYNTTIVVPKGVTIPGH